MALSHKAVAVGLVVLLSGCGYLRTQPGVVVHRVIDGDTLAVRINGEDEVVRLIGIDTPETHGRNGLTECYGAEATKHLERLVPPGTRLQLRRDQVARDRYDRLLVYAYRLDGGLVNLEQVQSGSADVLAIPPNTALSSQFAHAKSEARADHIGLWKQCGSADVAIKR